MDKNTLSAILFIAAGIVLVMYLMRRRKRRASR